MIRLLLVLISVGASATLHAQSDGPVHMLEGVWRTGARDGSWGFVRFAPCGNAFCGTLIGGGGANVDPQYFGTLLVQDMRWTGSEYAGGTLLDVENGWLFSARLRFRSADQLRVSGYVLGGFLCGGQTWIRVE